MKKLIFTACISIFALSLLIAPVSAKQFMAQDGFAMTDGKIKKHKKKSSKEQRKQKKKAKKSHKKINQDTDNKGKTVQESVKNGKGSKSK